MSEMSLKETPTKSLNDKKNYRVIKLENGLTALLVSDPTTIEENDDVEEFANSSEEDSSDEDVVYCAKDNVENKRIKKSQGPKLAAAALNIGVGSFHDPDDIPGLAHLLEHMVFMGSEKYPEQNSFEAFITRRGGYSNACTDCEETKFYFQVRKKYFYETLDRFSNFFISPLLKKDSVDKEIEAVDNEFQSHMQSDICRKDQLLGSFAATGHPMGKFTWGSCHTLKTSPLENGIDVHSRLAEFRKKYYISNMMNLAVQSQEDLDTLEKWVTEIFSQIPSGSFESTFSNLREPFNSPEFRKFYKVASVSSGNSLFLTWAFPPMDQYYKQKPLTYISHLIGHEGKGSLLSYLKQKVWALNLWAYDCCYEFQANTTCYLFCFSVELTDNGMEHVHEVLSGIFSYIAMLKYVGPNERIYEEMKLTCHTDFRWAEEELAIDYVKHFTSCMQKYPVEDYIAGDFLHFHYNKSLIEDCLNKLMPEDVNIMLLSKNHNTEDFSDQEPWYQTPYKANDISLEWINQWKNIEPMSDFFIPHPNNFIATDFTIKNEDIIKNEVPIQILNTCKGCLWYKQDIKFKVPKAIIMFHLKSPLIFSSLLISVLEDLFIMSFNQNIKEDVYPATLALLDYYVETSNYGLLIQVSGFNHQLEALLETLIDHIVQFDISDNMFEALKIELGRRYYDLCLEPSNMAELITCHITRQTFWTPLTKAKILNDVTKDLVLQFAKDLKSRLYIECLCQGNVSSEESLKIFELVETKLQCREVQPEEFKKSRLMKIPEGKTYCRVVGINSDDESSYVDNYYQCGPVDIYSACLFELLMEFMEEPCFNILRTQEQLGYSVHCQLMENFGIYGFSITVHSSTGKFSCSEIDTKIEEFLAYFRKYLNNLAEEEFKIQVSSLINFKEQPDHQLPEEVGRNIIEILKGDYVFDRLEKKIRCLQSISLKEFRDYFNIGTDECLNFNKLSVQIMAEEKCNNNEDVSEAEDILSLKYMYRHINDDNIPQSSIIMDIASFKENLEIFPYIVN